MKVNKLSKEFKGVWVPKAIYLFKELTPWDKFILSDIHSLCSSNQIYFKSNSTIGEEVGVSIPSVSRSVKKLVQLGLITSTYDGRIRHIKQTKALIKKINQATQSDEASTQIDAPPTQIEEAPTQIDAPLSQIDEGSNQNDKGSSQRDKGSSQRDKGSSQRDDSDSSERLDSIQESKHLSIQPSIHISKEVVYPFNKIEFIEAWKIWIQERKEKQLRNYTQRGEQSALHNLQKISNDDYKTAIQIINNSITHGWQGLFALKEQKTRFPKITEDTIRWANSRS
jgi:DNA-binding MarR family transcriptional regulator